jgi:transcription elongation factor GreA
MAPAPDREPISAEGLVELKAQLEDLEGRGRSEMAERIKAARELGDLKENADYHIAKEDQAKLETRIKRIRQRITNAEVVEASDAGDGDSFAFGRTAEVLDEGSGSVKTWTLVGSTEADLASGKLSAESPIGAALRDAAVGETVTISTPGGEKAFTVKKLVA